MEASRQGGQPAASRSAGEDLPVEDTRDPDGRTVACDAFDEPVTGIDREYRLQLDSRRCAKS
jgi:hypothetical protein